MISPVKDTSPYSGKKIRKYVPTYQPPKAGQLSSTVRLLSLSYTQEINNCTLELEKYRVMHKKDPTVRSCIEIKCLRAALKFGVYSHPNPKLENWVKSNIDNIQGSLKRVVGRLSGACAEGFRIAEIVFCNKMPGYVGEWRLKKFNILDSSLCSFEGQDGEITHVIYEGGSGERICIPYWKCIHIVNGFGLVDDDESAILGSPESRAAYPYFKAKQALLTEMVLSAKNNSQGTLIGKVDSSATVEQLDARGNPIKNGDGTLRTESAGMSLLRQMVNMGENGYLVTDKDNTIEAIQTPSTDQFFSNSINLLDKGILRAYGIPELIFQEGSSSIQFGSLGKQHESILDSQVESLVDQIREQLLEKVIRTLIIFNFGKFEEGYGSFENNSKMDPEKASTVITNIVSAVGSGIIPSNNMKVKNLLLELLGLDSVTAEEDQLDLQRGLISTYLNAKAQFGELPENLQPPLTPTQVIEQQQSQLALEQQQLAVEAEKKALEAQATEVPE